MSVQITEELSPEAKRRWGPVAYVITALKVLRRSHPFHADIAWDGGARHTRTVQIVVGNGRHYGAALTVAPDATIDDAQLDLYSLEVSHWWELLKLAPFLKRGTHVHRREVEALRAKVLEIRTRRPMPIDVDGELGAETPGALRGRARGARGLHARACARVSERPPTEGVPRTVKGLSLVSLFNDLASEMVYPLLPALGHRAARRGGAGARRCSTARRSSPPRRSRW